MHVGSQCKTPKEKNMCMHMKPSVKQSCVRVCVVAVRRFAELEVMLAEANRARGLYELAIQQPVLDMPEAVWKAYIDFEISEVGMSIRQSMSAGGLSPYPTCLSLSNTFTSVHMC